MKFSTLHHFMHLKWIHFVILVIAHLISMKCESIRLMWDIFTFIEQHPVIKTLDSLNSKTVIAANLNMKVSLPFFVFVLSLVVSAVFGI